MRRMLCSAVLMAALFSSTAQAADSVDGIDRLMVAHGDAQIETLAQGQGPHRLLKSTPSSPEP